MPGGYPAAWIKGQTAPSATAQHWALLSKTSEVAQDLWCQSGEASGLFRVGIWWSGALLALKYVLCFAASQMVNKIFSKHTTFSQQWGDQLVQNRVISVENTNCEWQEAAGRQSTICFLWQSQSPEMGAAYIYSCPTGSPQRTVLFVIKGLL